MKKYVFNLKMVGSNGSQSRQVIGAMEIESLEEVASLLNQQDFILVEKFHRNGNELLQIGPEILAQRVIGTVREYRDKPRAFED